MTTVTVEVDNRARDPHNGGTAFATPEHARCSGVVPSPETTGGGDPMRLILRALGIELIDLEWYGADETADAGDCTTYPVGFTPPTPAPHEYDTPDRDW